MEYAASSLQACESMQLADAYIASGARRGDMLGPECSALSVQAEGKLSPITVLRGGFL